MKTYRINGVILDRMFRNGLANLYLHEKKLNNLNVFPVADGDTGTNMRTTIEAGLKAAEVKPAAGAYLKSLSNAMLFGAHGNSGVIFSQIVKGIFLSLSHCGNVNPNEYKNALVSGYKTAYSAVVCPVEGTILTVAREGIERTKLQIARDASFEDLLGIYIAEMKKSLSFTPSLLPQLKEAGVVDSGAYGYIVFTEGMLKYLYGEKLDLEEPSAPTQSDKAPAEKTDAFNEYSTFNYGYCIEFVLQLLRAPQYSQRFNLNRFISDLQDYGTSIVAIQDERRVKVHIHSFKPAKVLNLGQEYGEYVSCKIENMQLQHSSLNYEREKPASKTPLAIISVADCDKTEQLFTELGSTQVIRCDGSKTVSAEDFINAVNAANAKKTVILPNGRDMFSAACKAKETLSDCDITVIDTNTASEGYCALAMDIADESDSEKRINLMRQGVQNICTLCVKKAEDKYAAEKDGEILACEKTAADAFIQSLKKIPCVGEMETCILFAGNDAKSETDLPVDKISAEYPDLEVCVIDGGSDLYSLTATLS